MVLTSEDGELIIDRAASERRWTEPFMPASHSAPTQGNAGDKIAASLCSTARRSGYSRVYLMNNTADWNSYSRDGTANVSGTSEKELACSLAEFR